LLIGKTDAFMLTNESF